MKPSRKHLAIALVSAAIILLQIAVTRVLSVLLWYHFAFFSISLAMLGVGAPGVWLSFAKPRPGRLANVLLAAAVLVPVGLALMINEQHRFGGWAIVYCLLCLLPAMLCLGAAVCLLLMAAPGSAVGRMYAYDLLGACIGAAAVVPLMTVVPTPQLAAAVGLLPLGARALLTRRVQVPELVIVAAVVAALAFGNVFAVRHTKQYAEAAGFTPIYEKWTPTTRLTVFETYPWEPERSFLWGVGSKAAGRPAPQQYWLEQDGCAGTPIVEHCTDRTKLEYLLYDVTSVGYQLRTPQRVAIVGAGGGRDILTARLAGARTIDAIEINSAIVAAMRGRFAAFNGGVYDLPGVRAIVGEGRSVLTRSAGGYDLIQISMIDSWAATAAGAYSLSENNLYTLEAFRLFLSRLSATGMISTSRWMPGPDAGLDLARLVRLAAASLEASGVKEVRRHMAVVQAGRIGTLLLSASALSTADIDQLRQVCLTRGFHLLFPEAPSTPPGLRWVSRWLSPNTDKLAKQGVVLTPPTDDKPFFFQIVSPFTEPNPKLAAQLGVPAQSGVVLRRLMMAMSVVTLVLFLVPFVTSRWLRPRSGFWRGSLFFICIGLAFMFVEIAWLQRFVLYLGHPSRATTAALGCLLLGAGLGAMSSARVGLARAKRWGWAVAAAVSALNLVFAGLFESTLGWPLGGRVLLTVLVLVPAGFAMGFFFPLGMVRFGDRNKAWFWALNGAASVLASVLSLALAMQLGLSMVAYLGAVAYLLAWLLLLGRNAVRAS